MAAITGLVLAAGAGTRAGGPKALRRSADGTSWLQRAVTLLVVAGCDPVLVVVGAAAEEVQPLVPAAARIVFAEHWAEGMSASIRAGIEASTGDAVLLTLVDLPDLPASVAKRVVAGNADGSATPVGAQLRQAVFGGRPGHPVLIGRDHWHPLLSTLSGDRGARPYLLSHSVDEIECGDLSDGEDSDS